ncbi:MAG: hypothetical protein Q9O74_12480 [Planctomycetota bacterium]|nr:hypothetical protein [Planctomycetota bacterium]
MSITNLRNPHSRLPHLADSTGRSRTPAPASCGPTARCPAPFSASGFRTAAFALLATASVAMAQVEEMAPAGDPIEETWRYLVELFRMILGF